MKLIRIALASLILALPIAYAAPAETPVGWSQVQLERNGETVTRISTGWVNYYDGQQWKPIDSRPKRVGNGWLVNEAPYSLSIPEFADEAVSFASTTLFDPDAKGFIDHAPISKTKQFAGVAHVRGVMQSGNIVYPGAHPLGDLLYAPLDGGFQALVRINELPPQCVSNPSGSVTVPFTESYSDNLFVRANGSRMNAAIRNIGNGWGADSPRKLITQPAYVWDSAGKTQDIDVQGRVAGGVLIASKVLPCDFLLSASYPVLTDTTTTVQSSSTDGQVEHTSGAAWATVRGATQGTAARTNFSTEAFLAWTGGSGDYYNIVIFLIFDTSALPDTDTITAATLSVYYPGATTSAMTMYAVKNRQSSDTLAITHYDEIGSSGPGTGDNYGSYTRSAGEAAGTETITLSAAGRENISKTATLTYFALVDSDHWDNATPTKTNTAGATIAMSERAGTTEDPTLEITHSAATSGGGGNAGKKAMIMALLSPTPALAH